jgi:signal transduction histidine kinase/ligand-binding sensor domain-containing protein/response regulator RpfG family c-di-GMP phosphodiesterase
MRLLYLLVILPFFVIAQSIHPLANGWQQLTISDGLSQGMIFGIVQDQKGFVWVATKDGLNRYDGHNFTVFTHDPYNSYSLSDNNCSALYIDHQQRLWVGTHNQGISLFNARTQRFYKLDILDQAAINAGNYEINSIREDPQGNIWVVANDDKLIKINLPSTLKTQFPTESNFTKQVRITQYPIDSKQCGRINHISFSANGQALAVCSFGTYRFNWQTTHKAGRFTPVPDEVKGSFIMYGDVDQDMWLAIATSNDAIIYNQAGVEKRIPVHNKNPKSLSLKALNTKTLAITSDDHLWVMSPDVLVRQNSLTASNAFTTLPTTTYGVFKMLEDRTGNIWIGTSGYGLRKFNPKVKQFHSSLPNHSLSYLYADRQGRMYVRYEYAYNQLDSAGSQMRPFLSNDLSVADKRARYMIQDREGTFWVSNTNFQTQEMQLCKFSRDWKLMKKYPLPPGTYFGFYQNQSIEDKTGKIWIGANNGKLLCFDPKTETSRAFSYQSLLPQKGAEIETATLYFDQAGTLWIGITSGLVRADHPFESPTFSLYKNSTKNRQSLSSNLVSSVIDDPYEPGRYLWVGTKGNGLDRLDKQTGHFDHITEAQGLPNKVVYGILSDEFNNLWLSTNRGLAQFNPKTLKFRNFTKADGLQDDEFNTGSFFKAPSGELMFGGVNGLTTFRASDVIQSKNTAPQVNLIGLKVNNETVNVGGPDGILNEGIDYIQRIDLSHTQNLLTLEFSVMDFANSAKNQYRYRLLGIDNDWVEAGTNRFANYAQLPDGRYTFQVMGSTDGHIWSKPITLQVQVHPPFYRTWWAYLLYIVLIAGGAWQFYRARTRQLLLEQRIVFEQKEASRLAELDGQKTQFFTSISHEFRTPLTLILGPLADLKQRFPTEAALGLMERNGQRLLNLINQLLDLSKLEAGQLRIKTEMGDLAAFFRTLASSFNSLAESRQIRFSFSQDQDMYWADFDRDKLEKIVSNLLSNAFKFTPAGNDVWMRVHYFDAGSTGHVEFTIQDTGVGIAAEHVSHIFERFYQVDSKVNQPYEGTGIGLALVNELVKVLNGTINVVSIEGAGTTFTITLPIVAGKAIPSPASVRTSEPTGSVETASPQEQVDNRAVASILDETVSATTDKVLLIIDDNADIRVYVRSIFDADYQIVEAVDGQDGLDKATQALPDVVICDLMMPRLSGFEFCRMLKTQSATSHIPVVMLTAKATTEDRIEGFELGADDYLTKPFNRTELQTRVRNLIEQRKRLYTWFSRQHDVMTVVDTDTPSVVADTAQPPTPVLALLAGEQAFIDRLTTVVHQHLSEPAFSVEAMAEAANLSRSQLHRKLKTLLDTSPTVFIRDIRLSKAAELLTEGEQSVTQVAYAVGFDNLSYFAKTFQERYGVPPSQYGRLTTSPS